MLALDERGRKLYSSVRPSGPLKELPSILDALFSRRPDLRPESLLLGARGIWTTAERKKERETLKRFARDVTVYSDVELAHAGIFGSSPGILVLAGTGSVAYGLDARGRAARAGGRGRPGGDPGSGTWLGRGRLAAMAWKELAKLAAAVVKKLNFPGAVPMGTAGGLFKGRGFDGGFREEVGKELPGLRLVFVRPGKGGFLRKALLSGRRTPRVLPRRG